MKCTKCGDVAIIGMPQHRLNLCEEHFVEWVPSMVSRAISKYKMFAPDDRLLVAVSGGKDSLSLWDILVRLGYETEGLYINLGIDHQDYSDISEAKVRAFASEHGNLALRVVNLSDTYGAGIPELTFRKRRDRPCSLCGVIKRHIMNQAARDGGFAAIVTGHNLDDEAAVLMQNTLHWEVGYLRRQAPVLPASHPGLARKAKPLCHLYEREVAAYALVHHFDFVQEECPFSVGAKTIFYKTLLNQLETRSRGAKMQFYLQFLRAKESSLFAEEHDGVQLHTCVKCGQATVADDLCAFCRLWETVR